MKSLSKVAALGSFSLKLQHWVRWLQLSIWTDLNLCMLTLQEVITKQTGDRELKFNHANRKLQKLDCQDGLGKNHLDIYSLI